jgi:hypothetical protein
MINPETGKGPGIESKTKSLLFFVKNPGPIDMVVKLAPLEWVKIAVQYAMQVTFVLCMVTKSSIMPLHM